ncbi:MAG: cellulase family glycosylhydrolase, partial [Chloroflexota bacterium]
RQYDRLIATYAKMGVKSMIILNQETVWGKAPWAGSNDWDGYAAEFAEMAGQIAAHYRSYKDRVAFEIWNEGDLDHNAASVYVPPAQFAKILSSSAKAIKRAAPKAIRIFGGLATGPQTAVKYLNDTRAALGNELPVEAIGIHPYGRWATKAPFDWGQRFGTLGQAINEYKAGTNGIPLWITEVGVADDNEIGPQYYQGISEYIRDMFKTTDARYKADVPVLVWFAWSDFMRNAGVVTKDGRRKSAVYAAFQDVRDGTL